MPSFCEEFTPGLSKNSDGLTWTGYTYPKRENRDAHMRLFQTGAKVKLFYSTGRLWWRRYHLIVGMP